MIIFFGIIIWLWIIKISWPDGKKKHWSDGLSLQATLHTRQEITRYYEERGIKYDSMTLEEIKDD